MTAPPRSTHLAPRRSRTPTSASPATCPTTTGPDVTTTTLDAPAWAPSTTLRSGSGYWLTAYRTMLRWHLSSLRMWLFLLVMIQIMFGVGYVLGFALFFHEIPRTAALWVSTGTPVLPSGGS